MSTRTQPEPAEAPIEAVLQAMADNYSASRAVHQWDHLDTAACVRAAKEIRGLRAALATPSPQPAEARLQAECDVITELNHRQWLSLENVRLLAARHRKEEWAQHMLRFCEEAGATASPLRSQPAEAKTAAVDGMTDATPNIEAACAIYALPCKWPDDFSEGPREVRRDKMRAAIRAAIATQEGGHD